jgi:hypothetical protein
MDIFTEGDVIPRRDAILEDVISYVVNGVVWLLETEATTDVIPEGGVKPGRDCVPESDVTSCVVSIGRAAIADSILALMRVLPKLCLV